jgi:hypothetical protein
MESTYFETSLGRVRCKFTVNNASYSYYKGREFIGVNNPDGRFIYGGSLEEAEELIKDYINHV